MTGSVTRAKEGTKHDELAPCYQLGPESFDDDTLYAKFSLGRYQSKEVT